MSTSSTSAYRSKYDASSPLIGGEVRASDSSGDDGLGSRRSSPVPPPVLIGDDVVLRFSHHETTSHSSSSSSSSSANRQAGRRNGAAASPPASPLGNLPRALSLPFRKSASPKAKKAAAATKASHVRSSSSSSSASSSSSGGISAGYYQHAAMSSSLPVSPISTHTSTNNSSSRRTRAATPAADVRLAIKSPKAKKAAAARRKSMSESSSTTSSHGAALGDSAHKSNQDAAADKEMSMSSSHAGDDSDSDLENGEGGRRSHHTDPHPHNHGPKAVKGGSVTVGGRNGYIARRVFHVIGFAFLPFFYYILLPGLYDAIGVTDIDKVDRIVVVIVILLYFCFEPIRMRFGLIGFGQREWERHQPSTQFWSTISFLFVVAFAPPDAVNEVNAIPGFHWENLVNRGIYGAPIVWAVVIDALLGEMRRTKWSQFHQSAVGTIAIFAIWLISSFVLGTPWWFAILMPPITVAAEYPDLRIIDDNAMMLMIPFFAVFMIDSFGGREAGAALYDAVHSAPRY